MAIHKSMMVSFLPCLVTFWGSMKVDSTDKCIIHHIMENITHLLFVLVIVTNRLMIFPSTWCIIYIYCRVLAIYKQYGKKLHLQKIPVRLAMQSHVHSLLHYVHENTLLLSSLVGKNIHRVIQFEWVIGNYIHRSI